MTTLLKARQRQRQRQRPASAARAWAALKLFSPACRALVRAMAVTGVVPEGVVPEGVVPEGVRQGFPQVISTNPKP